MDKLSNLHASKWLPPAAVILAIFLVWEIAARASGDNGAPAPTGILAAVFSDAGFLFHHVGLTLFEALAGMLIAIAAAFVVSTAFAQSPLAHTAFMPLVLAAQAIPMLAIAPLLAQAIGEGMFSNIAVTAYLCWFPAIVAFTHGFLKVDPARLALFQLHGATRYQTWRRLRLPGAAPIMVAGVRTSAGLAVISAIVSEYGTLVGGIGATIANHVRGNELLSNDRLFALVVLAAISGLLFTEVMHRAARFTMRDWLSD